METSGKTFFSTSVLVVTLEIDGSVAIDEVIHDDRSRRLGVIVAIEAIAVPDVILET